MSEDLKALRERVIAEQPSRELDARIWAVENNFIFDRKAELEETAFDGTAFWLRTERTGGLRLAGSDVPHYTSRLHDAQSLVPLDWWITMGRCGVSGHTTIGPDFNGPTGDELKRRFDENEWHEGISYDLVPGNGDITVTCRAICAAWLEARERQRG